MFSLTNIVIVAFGLFLAILFFIEIGYRIGRRRLMKDPDYKGTGLGAIEGALFALLGLIIAFTFSNALTKFDVRRALVAEETNDIGTAYLRIDLLRPEDQAPLRDQFKKYLDSRISTFKKMPDIAATMSEYKKSEELQRQLWQTAVDAAAHSTTAAPMLLMPAINNMIDITTTRMMATKQHPPGVIFILFIVLILVCSMLAGHGMSASGKRSLMHWIGFALVLTVTTWTIVDIEYPRIGIIQVQEADQMLIDLRNSMN